MAHPDFLGPGTTINLNSSALMMAATPGAVGGGAPGSRVLGFAIQSQLQSNWCWAAVSTSVAHFYDSSADSYQSGGDWTHSYLTEAATAGGVGAVVADALASTQTPHPSAIGA